MKEFNELKKEIEAIRKCLAIQTKIFAYEYLHKIHYEITELEKKAMPDKRKLKLLLQEKIEIRKKLFELEKKEAQLKNE